MQVPMGVERPQSDERQFRSVGEAARVFGVSEMTLYRAIHDGKFPAVRIMGRLIVPLRAIEAMASAAIEHNELVDAADWVDPAMEESSPAVRARTGNPRHDGINHGRNVLADKPAAGHPISTRLAAGHASTRGRPSARTRR